MIEILLSPFGKKYLRKGVARSKETGNNLTSSLEELANEGYCTSRYIYRIYMRIIDVVTESGLTDKKFIKIHG